MLVKNKDSSSLTKNLQARTIYANYIVQRQKQEQGCGGSLALQTGSGSTLEFSNILLLQQGAIFTDPIIQSTILASNQCPSIEVQSDPVPPPQALRLLILGDLNVSTVSSSINSRLTALGYTDYSITARSLGTTETGADLNTNNYNVLFIWTNSSQTGAVALGTAVQNFVNAGGHVVSGTFIWSLRPTGYPLTTTPFTATAQSSDSTGNMTVSVVHPITTGVGTTLTNNNSIFNNGNVGLQSGTSVIATFTSSGVPMVGIRTLGSSNLVGFNIGVYSLPFYTNLRNLVINGILWTIGLI
jgi:hypothetical protein